MSGPYDGDAQQKVSGPATALLVTGIIGVALQALGLLLRFLGIGMFAAMAQQQGGAQADQAQYIAMLQGVAGVVAVGVGTVVSCMVAAPAGAGCSAACAGAGRLSPVDLIRGPAAGGAAGGVL